jgi:hypothetical protein
MAQWRCVGGTISYAEDIHRRDVERTGGYDSFADR